MMAYWIGNGSGTAILLGLDWPAWVQAIGSIAAIIVAILIARRQSRNQLKLSRHEETKFLRYAILEAHKGTDCCQRIHAALKECINGREKAHFKAELSKLTYTKQSIARIDSLPVTVWPDYTYTQCFHNWSRAVAEFEKTVPPLLDQVIDKEVKAMSQADIDAMDALIAVSRASLGHVERNFESFDGNKITLERARQDRMFLQRAPTAHPSARWYR